jgi:hypothetical protein
MAEAKTRKNIFFAWISVHLNCSHHGVPLLHQGRVQLRSLARRRHDSTFSNRLLLAKLTVDSVTTNPKRTFMQTRLRLVFCLFLVAGAAVVLVKIVTAEANGGSDRLEGQCDPFLRLSEFFDGVTPPALPSGWSSTTWVTSDSGVPTPPADTLPNAVFVDDPATISDKQLLSPTIGFICDLGPLQVSFRNNFNFQDGFDGGVLEVSYDHGLTFQDVLAVGGTFVLGGYNGTINSCCGNPLAGRQAWTGNSGGFIDTTVVNLPDGCVVDTILRWRMGSDSSVSGEGWRIDNVNIVQCHTHFPPRRDHPTPRPRPTPR